MRIGILGPLTASDEGRELELGGGRQRALLALLVLHADQIVPVDRLIDELWGADSPRSAAKIVQGYVSQLRRVLPPDTIATHDSGYRLHGIDTDAGEFERLIAEARTQAPRDAVRTLNAANGLWRGRPLGEVGYEAWAQAEIARLEELRLVALEERVAAELELGEAASIVPELETLVTEHPLREGLCTQLMLALYRSGRQADALKRYVEGRRSLVEELGIEPGPELRQLQQRILTHDPTLDRAAHPLVRDVRRLRLRVAAAAMILVGTAVASILVFVQNEGRTVSLFPAIRWPLSIQPWVVPSPGYRSAGFPAHSSSRTADSGWWTPSTARSRSSTRAPSRGSAPSA